MSHIAGKEGANDHIKILEEHFHKEAKVYPTLAAGVTLTAAASSWVLGTTVEVIPASTITDDFDIHYVQIEDISANGTYEIVLYSGAGDTEVGRVRIVRSAVQSEVLAIPIMTPIIAKNSRIRAAVASSGGASETVDISLFYHTY